MLAGKWISKMFEADEKKIISFEKDKLSYEFTCSKNFKEMEKIIGGYFLENYDNAKFYNYDTGKVSIIIKYKKYL